MVETSELHDLDAHSDYLTVPVPYIHIETVDPKQLLYQVITEHGDGIHKLNLTDNIERLLGQLGNSDLELDLEVLNNINGSLLSNSLWPFLQPYNWREDAHRQLLQPEYIIMLVLCLVALVTNVLSIVAICNVKRFLTTHMKLIMNLAVSDILIVFSIFILIMNKVYNQPLPIGITRPEDRMSKACFFATVNSVNIVAFLITLLNLFAMAVDHYIAIMMPLHYARLLSKRRGNTLLLVLWILASMGGFSNFLVGLIGYRDHSLFNYCEYIMYDGYHAEMLIFVVTIVCLFTIVVIYTRLYFEVKKLQALAQLIPNYSFHNNKAMITTLLIIGIFSLCWLPNSIFQITLIIQIQMDKDIVYQLFSKFLQASKYLHILPLVNCIADPIIYAVRLEVVQQGYRNFQQRVHRSYKNMKSYLKNRQKIQTLKAGYRPPFYKPGCGIELRDSFNNRNGCNGHVSPDIARRLVASEYTSENVQVQENGDFNDNELSPLNGNYKLVETMACIEICETVL